MPRIAAHLHDPAPGEPDTPAPPPGILVAGHFREGRAYRVRRQHGTRDWLLTYTVAGCGLYRQGESAWPAQPGDLWLLPPGAAHDYATSPAAGRWEFWWAHFIPRPHWAPWLRWPSPTRGVLHLELGEPGSQVRLRRTWEGLVADARAGGVLAQDLALNGLEEILLLAARRAQEALRGAAGGAWGWDARVRDTLDFVAAHLPERQSLPALAARVSLSPSRLAHLVKQETGTGLVEAVAALRLSEAARLLQFTARSVGEIALDVGFASPFYFSRRFAARYGSGPRAYRAAVRAAGAGAAAPGQP